MSDVFLSYSRRDTDVVRTLCHALEADRRDVWVDWDDILPTARWLQEIQTGIEGADACVCILSPDYVLSDICRREVEYAVLCKKRLIPIVHRDVAPAAVHPPLASLNWLFFRDADNFDDAFRLLIATLDADLDYVHMHTQLLVRALEWESKGSDQSLALRGKTLEEAELWSVKGTDKKPGPTELQRRYIALSRRVATTRQRKLFGAICGALAVTMILAIITFIQYRVAQMETQRALAALLVAQSQAVAAQGNFDLANGQFDLGLLLSARGYQIATNYNTRESLLNALEYSPQLVTVLQDSSTQTVSDLVFSADGQTLISADTGNESIGNYRLPAFGDGISDDTDRLVGRLSPGPVRPYGGVTLWSMATKQPHHLLLAALRQPQGVENLVLSPDGKTFASQGAGSLLLWDASTGALLGTLDDEPALSTARAVFSPDGKLLISVGCSEFKYGNGSFCHDVPLLVWNVATGKRISSVDTIQDGFLTFSPDGRLLVTWGCVSAFIFPEQCSAGRILFWDMATGQPEAFANAPVIDACASVARVQFSPDGKLFAVLCRDGSIKLLDVAVSSLARSAGVSAIKACAAANDIQFSPDGRIFVVDCGDGGMQVWDAATKKLRGSPLDPGSSGRRGIVFNASGSMLASYGGQTIQVWNPTTGKLIGKSVDPYGAITQLAWSSANQIATSDASNALLLWRGADDVLPGRLPGRLLPSAAVAASPDGHLLAVGEKNRTVVLWNRALMAEIGTLFIPAGTPDPQDVSAGSQDVTGVAFSEDGRRLAAVTYDGHIAVWHFTTRTLLASFAGSFGASQLALSPDGRLLASGGRERVDLWTVATQTMAKQFVENPAGSAKAAHIAFSPDGQTLGSSFVDNDLHWSVVLWNVATGSTADTFIPTDPADPLSDLSFSPDGHTMALISRNGIVSLWDTGARQSPGQFSVNNGAVFYNTVTFSPDGKMLAVGALTGTEDRDHSTYTLSGVTISFWYVATHELLAHSFSYKGVEDVPEATFMGMGQSLAFLGPDSVLRDISPESWQARVCSLANRNLSADEWGRFGNGEPYSRVCPRLPVHEDEIRALFFRAIAAAKQGDAETAAAAYRQATRWARETDDAILNNYICWYGTLDRFAKEVLPACERAVTLEPTNGIYRDSRGLAQALTGNQTGAIADFQSFVIWAMQNTLYADTPYVAERGAWMNELRAGQNPFSPKLLDALRNE